MIETTHNPKCECSKCRPDLVMRIIPPSSVLQQTLREVRDYLQGVQAATCNCTHCSASRVWVEKIDKVLK